MKRKSILFLLLMVGMCNALVAQSLTTKKEYYDWLGLHLQRKYTVLPDGTQHGKEYYYRQDGTLEYIFTYNDGELVSSIEYYEDGKTIAFKENALTKDIVNAYTGVGGTTYSPTDAVEYDIRGKVIAKYVMKHTPGKSFLYGDQLMEYMLVSYSDDMWKYTLSSDGNKAEIKNVKEGSHFTYDYKKEQLTVHSWKVGINGNYDKYGDGRYDHSGTVGTLTIKGSTVNYQFDMNADVYDAEGYAYRFKKGDKRAYQFKNTFSLPKDEFCFSFFNRGNEEQNYRTVVVEDPSSKYTRARVLGDYLSKECVHLRSSMKISYGGKQKIYTLEVESENGSYKYFTHYTLRDKTDAIKAKTENGKIVSFSAPGFFPTKFEVVQIEGGVEIKMIEGKQVINSNKDGDITFEGKFVNNELVEGSKKCKNYEMKGKFANGELVEGVKTLTRVIKDEKVMVTNKGTFRNGSLVDGTEQYKTKSGNIVNTYKKGVLVEREITHTDGSVCRMNGVIKEVQVSSSEWNGNSWVTTQTPEIQLLSGNLELELAGGRDLFIDRWFASDIYLQAKSFKCSIPSNKIYLVKKNGDIFEGVIPDELLNMFVGEYTEHKSSVKVIEGKYTNHHGNILEGTFKKRDILYKGLDPRLHISGTADFTTEFGHYTGGYAKSKAEGAGKIIIDNLGELEGTFAGDKISKDSVCTVDFKFPNGDTFKGYLLDGKAHGMCELRFANGDYYIGEFVGGKFSGTGDVRYTHKKGVFEGKIVDFVCQYDTPQGKKALKKVKAPKMPKISLPSKVGDMYVKL